MKQDGDDRYLEIHWDGAEYIVNVRWCDDKEQHEVWAFDDVPSLSNFVEDFYSD